MIVYASIVDLSHLFVMINKNWMLKPTFILLNEPLRSRKYSCYLQWFERNMANYQYLVQE